MRVKTDRIGPKQQKGFTASRERAMAKYVGDLDLEKYMQKVETKAYELYENRGKKDGQDWADWFEAERLVEEELINRG